MAIIDLEGSFTEFLESQVQAGLFDSISEAAEDAIRRRMEDYEQHRMASIQLELTKGENSVESGELVTYSKSLMSEISELGRRKAIVDMSNDNEIKT